MSRNKKTEVVTESRQDDEYNFSHKRRGVAIVVMIDKDEKGRVREGSEHDKTNFQDALTSLGFEVRFFQNKSKAELLENLQKASREDHSDCDCFVLAISSHGDEREYNRVREDVIHTIDGTVKTREIIEMFTDKHCQSLAGKPRICFIQACRGNKLDEGHDVYCVETSKNEDVPDSLPIHRNSRDAVSVQIRHQLAVSSKHLGTQEQVHYHPQPLNPTYHPRVIQKTKGGRQVVQQDDTLSHPVVSPAPCYKDFVVMYATPPGYFAFRRPTEGSWFVKCLAAVLLKCDGKRSFLRELTKVTGMVASEYSSVHSKPAFDKKKQTPVIYSMLCKDIFMTPKAFAK